MKTTQPKTGFARMPKDYAGLCRILTPRPIHDKAEFQNILEITDALAGHKLTPDQEDYFDLLCSLIEEYDSKNVKWPNVMGVDVLKHLLGEQGLAAADLSRLLGGSRNLGAMILRGERKLTLNHVRTLSRRFGVSADLFLS